jgi:predicted metal-binding membrane protein
MLQCLQNPFSKYKSTGIKSNRFFFAANRNHLNHCWLKLLRIALWLGLNGKIYCLSCCWLVGGGGGGGGCA